MAVKSPYHAQLAEGYSTEDYPDYVEIDTSRLPGKDPLHNSGGGFVYKWSYIGAALTIVVSRGLLALFVMREALLCKIK